MFSKLDPNVPSILVLGALGLPLLAQAPNFEVDITNVRLQAAVRDGARIIRNLTRDDFIVYDQGRPSRIVAFEQESLPLDLAVLLDISGSMHRDLRELAMVADRALGELRSSDRVAVFAFSVSARLEQPLTTDLSLAAAAIRRTVSRKNLDITGTRLIPPLATTASILSNSDQSPAGRRQRAILIVTDNQFGDTGAPSDDEIIGTLQRDDIVLHAIVVHRKHISVKKPPPLIDPSNPRYTRENVFHIASATGGDGLLSQRTEDSLAEILTRIRARYTIWISPPMNQGTTFRQVKVALSEDARKRFPKATVHTREGYYPTSMGNTLQVHGQ